MRLTVQALSKWPSNLPPLARSLFCSVFKTYSKRKTSVKVIQCCKVNRNSPDVAPGVCSSDTERNMTPYSLCSVSAPCRLHPQCEQTHWFSCSQTSTENRCDPSTKAAQTESGFLLHLPHQLWDRLSLWQRADCLGTSPDLWPLRGGQPLRLTPGCQQNNICEREHTQINRIYRDL